MNLSSLILAFQLGCSTAIFLSCFTSWQLACRWGHDNPLQIFFTALPFCRNTSCSVSDPCLAWHPIVRSSRIDALLLSVSPCLVVICSMFWVSFWLLITLRIQTAYDPASDWKKTFLQFYVPDCYMYRSKTRRTQLNFVAARRYNDAAVKPSYG